MVCIFVNIGELLCFSIDTYIYTHIQAETYLIKRREDVVSKLDLGNGRLAQGSIANAKTSNALIKLCVCVI